MEFGPFSGITNTAGALFAAVISLHVLAGRACSRLATAKVLVACFPPPSPQFLASVQTPDAVALHIPPARRLSATWFGGVLHLPAWLCLTYRGWLSMSIGPTGNRSEFNSEVLVALAGYGR
jgi:hypothetical protein